MSGAKRNEIDNSELCKRVIHGMHEAWATIKYEFLGREAQYEAHLPQSVSCVHILSITFLCPGVMGKQYLFTGYFMVRSQ